MATRRMERVARAIKEAVSEVVRDEINDPRIGRVGSLVTITRVTPTADLREAKVYYSVLGPEADRKRVAGCLLHARGFIQREVGRRLSLRFCPHLTLLEDEALRTSLEVEAILREEFRERDTDAEPTVEHDVAAGPDTA